jgi:MoxR-like ATPase
MPNDGFHLLDPRNHPNRPPEVLAGLDRSRDLNDHVEAAPFFQPSDELVDAINIALAVEAPLLLTGEPGTGKTQVAFYVAHYFGLEERLFRLYVRSTTRAEDLLYRFDEVAYFHAAQDPAWQGQTIDRGRFVEPGPLWRAYATEGPSIVLIDEIDKAPRDFPNDLLNVLDQHQFRVHPTGETLRPTGKPPLLVITSNSERRLPEPFLRRVIFHNILFDEDLLRRAVAARGARLELDEAARETAIERFLELRSRNLRKKPATAELLVWLTVLSARKDVTAGRLRAVPLGELPGLATLVKDRDDLAQL